MPAERPSRQGKVDSAMRGYSAPAATFKLMCEKRLRPVVGRKDPTQEVTRLEGTQQPPERGTARLAATYAPTLPHVGNHLTRNTAGQWLLW
jgi:hypothetical protein